MSETNNPRRALRSVGAVVAALLAVFVVTTAVDVVLHATGVFPPWGERMGDGAFLLATAYRVVLGVGGGWVAARLAPDRPVGHALALGVVGLLLSTVGAVATWNRPELGPRWYPLAVVAMAIPCAWAGGELRRAQLRAHAHA
jgi:hypothetical protein